MKAISIYRITIIIAAYSAALIFLLGQENEESTKAFFLAFLFNKTLAAVLFVAATKMYNKWRKTDAGVRWVSEQLNKDRS